MLTTDQELCGKDVAVGMENMSAVDAIFEEKNYREAVETLMRLQSDKVIGNSLPSHAAILYEMFFKNAKNRIRIFCKNLNNEVFGNRGVVEAAKSAIERKVGIDILLQDNAAENGAFSQFLEEHKTNPFLKFRRANKKNIRTAPLNFSVMDEQALRYEKDREKCKAFAIMFAPELSKLLVGHFEQMFADAVSLSNPVGE